MQQKALDVLGGMEYAVLKESQQTRLQELEKQFNSEFSTHVYFLVMNKIEQ